MKKREFQKKAAAALLKKLAEVCAEAGKNPNIAVLSRYNSSYFKLRHYGNQIQISVRETGELSYQLTDMLGSTDGRKIYYRYQEKDDFACIIKKFADDFGRLYKDFLMAGTLHGYYGIELSYIYDYNMTKILTSHDVTWSRRDSYCRDQYLIQQEEETPTAPVTTRIKQLDPPEYDPGFSKYNFEEACE